MRAGAALFGVVWGCGAPAPPELVPAEQVVQGVGAAMQIPVGAAQSVVSNRWMVRTDAVGGSVEIDVLRHVSGTPDAEAGAARVRQVFSGDTVVRDEAEAGGGWWVSHHGGGSAGVHRLLRAGGQVFECWAAFRDVPDPLAAIALGTEVCGSLTLDATRGSTPAVEVAGEAPSAWPPPDPDAGPGRVALHVASGPELGTEVAVALAIDTVVAPDGLHRHTVTLGAVEILRFDTDDVLTLYGEAARLEGASGRTLVLTTSPGGQLVDLTAGDGEASQLVDQMSDILAQVAITRPATPVGPGAVWTVVEPRDARRPVPSGTAPVVTRYQLHSRTSGRVRVVREPILPPRASSRQQVRAEATYDGGALPVQASGEMRLEITVPERDPVVTRTRWDWRDPSQEPR